MQPEFQPGFPSDSGPVLLHGPAGALSVAVDFSDCPLRVVTAVLCHPLSTEGGSMRNKVVTMAAQALRELGTTTVRFDFRGVGKSAGTFDDGIGEADDLRAVIGWARAQRSDDALWLVGFSFGAFVSLSIAADVQPQLLISIAPPVGRSWDFDSIRTPTCPWLVIQGEADEVVEPGTVYRWVETRQPKPQLVRIPATTHFFHGRLIDLKGAIKAGVRAHLPPADA